MKFKKGAKMVNEIELSNDIKRIETEIDFYKQQAGQSIWEIGKRLNHVKENDLAHGEFMDWVKRQGIEQTAANRMMKISKELPNSATLHNLGASALYLIATLPDDQKETEMRKAEEGSPSTVREIQGLKRKNKELEQQLQYEMNKQPKERVIEKKITPHDYPGLKSDNQQLSEALKEAQTEADAFKQRNEFIEKEYNELIDQRKEVDEKSRKYDELTEGLQELEGKMNDTQKMLASHKKVIDTIRHGNELLDTLSGLIYTTDIEILEGNKFVNSELNKLTKRVEWWLNDINKKMNNATILEGEIVYD